MFDLEKSIEGWKKELRKNQGLESGSILELESHLRDKIDHLIASGLSQEESFNAAILKIGSADTIGGEYYRNNSTRFNNTPPWESRNNISALIKNYLKVAFRTILRNKTYSLVNISGLALGLACSFLILVWVLDELSFDRFHPDAEHIYSIYQQQLYSGGHQLTTDNLPGPLKDEMISEIPEVKNATRFLPSGYKPVKYEQKSFNEMICLADPEFLEMFGFPLLKGNPDTALNEPFSIILTEQAAEKFFGKENPIGKSLLIDEKIVFKVTGILKKIPSNTHLNYISIIIPFINGKEVLGQTFDQWGWNWPRTYVTLTDTADINQFNQKILPILKNHGSESSSLYSIPVVDRHLFFPGRETIKYVYIFGSVSLFILLIACINFMNLSTARSQKRIAEVGLRKTIGARKENLIFQFMGESLMLSILAMILGMFIVEISLPMFNFISGKEFTLMNFMKVDILLLVAGITLITGIASGSYPALYFSSFNPADTLKGKLKSGPKAAIFRNTLVVVQFSLSIFLIAGTLVINSQMSFIQKKDLGYNNKNLVYIPMKPDIVEKYPTIKSEWLTSPLIKDVTSVSRLPVYGGNSSSNFQWEGKDPELSVLINVAVTDNNYLQAMQMTLADGKGFVSDISSEKHMEYILNEEAVRQMQLSDPVGKWFGQGESRGIITGVVKDFNFSSLHNAIEPMLIINYHKSTKYILVRLVPGKTCEALSFLENSWNNINPSSLFVSTFLDQRLENLYGSEKKLLKLFNIFSVLALFIACLGMFGLSLFAVEQRIKEIGIRKTLGGTVSGIVFLLAKDFTKWVIAANIIAWPLGWFVFDKWLSHFAYHTDISIISFISAGVSALLIALIAVCYQSFKAAMSNPVKALRYE